MADAAKPRRVVDGVPQRPSPQLGPAVQGFYDALAEGHLVIARCADCGRHDLPGTRTCPQCLSHDLRWHPANGRGTVYSFVVFRRALHPAFQAPYAVCVVELDEGPRIVAALSGVEPEAIAVGLPVQAVFGAEAGDDPTIPVRFRRLQRSSRRRTTLKEERRA